MEEVLRALAYPKVRRFIRGDVASELWFEDIVVLADLVAGEMATPGVCEDPDDDKYIAAALEGRAGVIVTGDRGLLALKEPQGIPIVTPREFLDLLDQSAAEENLYRNPTTMSRGPAAGWFMAHLPGWRVDS